MGDPILLTVSALLAVVCVIVVFQWQEISLLKSQALLREKYLNKLHERELERSEQLNRWVPVVKMIIEEAKPSAYQKLHYTVELSSDLKNEWLSYCIEWPGLEPLSFSEWALQKLIREGRVSHG